VPLASFHPAVAGWFRECIGTPTAAQDQGWPVIRSGANCLIAAPTGTGKTLAAFLCAIDALVAQGPYLADRCAVLYVSPLRALSNDVQKNLLVPAAGIAARDAFVPRLRVLVRTGDTTAAQRAAMGRRAPHILVTTPESLGIMLTSAGGRRLLADVRTVIVDEIHAVAGNKRGAHLALSLERLAHLVGESPQRPLQRIGLSATQRPLDQLASFLVGADRPCTVVDAGHLRDLDLGVLIPQSPLTAVCAHETWGEVYGQLVELIRAHHTTLVFVNTRKLAERISLRLIERFDADDEPGAQLVACHHGSLSKERRLDAEQRLKAGALRVLVATATLELGIDIGDVDLVVQIGSPRAIATFLQRVGRSGHGVGRLPKARLVALTTDELTEAAALLRAVRSHELDHITIPVHPWDVLAQQAVAACVDTAWPAAALHALLCRAWPYRDVDAEAFRRVLDLHSDGRRALLHLDPATDVVRGTRRARLTAMTCGGAIPDTAAFQVREEPGDLVVGTLDEDFSLESSPGDIFQLGNTSWRILRVEGREGVVRVADAHGAAPTIPFWIGEAPGRTRELSQAVGRLRADCDSPQWLERECLLSPAAAQACWDHLEGGRRALGKLPTHTRVVAERFFDDSGGQQLVIHSCFGTRINRAWGLALRKRFCVGFGFELEAAATEEGLVLSIGPDTSFPLDEVFTYLTPQVLRATLIQACVTGGQFETRWRWAAGIALLVERFGVGKKVPPFLVRIRANDALVVAFPGARTCPDNLPPGKIDIPEDHPIVAQVVADCLHDLMDLDGLSAVISGIRDQRIDVHAVDTPEPSPLALGILAARPYAFLDDTPFEERRTRAVAAPSTDPLPPLTAGTLDPEAVAQVRAEAWPDPRDREEMHEILCWIGYVTAEEAHDWAAWLVDLQDAGRAELLGGRWYAVGTTRDPIDCWRGRLEALGPIVSDDDALLALEQEGVAMRVRLDGVAHWCHRRLLQRILRVGRDRRRSAVEPAAVADLLRFLARWQGVASDDRRDGASGVAATLAQLAGLELPAAAWMQTVLPQRVRAFRPEWLDEVTLGGDFAWGRLWAAPALDGDRASTIRTTPIAFVPRSELDAWLRLSGPAGEEGLSGPAREVLAAIRARGALFLADLLGQVRQLAATIESALGELIAAGLISCDSFAALRWLLLSSQRRADARPPPGRWGPFRPVAGHSADSAGRLPDDLATLVARTLLRRTGVVVRRLYDRERIRAPWRDLLRALRVMELRGEVLGGRFVAGLGGEQFALPDAAAGLRKVRGAPWTPLDVGAADPLNYTGILLPGERVRPGLDGRVAVG